MTTMLLMMNKPDICQRCPCFNTVYGRDPSWPGMNMISQVCRAAENVIKVSPDFYNATNEWLNTKPPYWCPLTENEEDKERVVLTDRDRAILTAYTGYALLTGEKMTAFYEYCREKLKRPVLTHELKDAALWEELKKASEEDFYSLIVRLAK